jgi:hypothetical protein
MPRKTTRTRFPEAVAEPDAAEVPETVGLLPDQEGLRLVVVEWDSSGDDLDGVLQEAAEALAVGGVLYFTLPRHLDGAEIIAKLGSLFRRIGPLNVGTNPKIQDNDVRTRAGYACLK